MGLREMLEESRQIDASADKQSKSNAEDSMWKCKCGFYNRLDRRVCNVCGKARRWEEAR